MIIQFSGGFQWGKPGVRWEAMGSVVPPPLLLWHKDSLPPTRSAFHSKGTASCDCCNRPTKATSTSRSWGPPCGPGSAGTPQCRGCSHRRGRCSGRAGSWGSPRIQAGSGHTAARTHRGSSGTGPSPHRRMSCTSLVGGTHKLQGEQERSYILVASALSSAAQGTTSHVRLHPLGPNPKVPGAHLLHCLPTTLGRHWHCPPLGSHTELSEPWGSHWQAGQRREAPRAVSDTHPMLPVHTWKHHRASRCILLYK